MTSPDLHNAETPTRALDEDALFARLKGWFVCDWDHHSEWREEAEEAYDFAAGRQWDDETLRELERQGRPASVFNRIGPMIDAVSGFEVSNRQEARFIPRKMGSAGVNELLTSAANWFRDQTDAEDEESDAFRDAIICGLGWTETRIDYDTNADGDPRVERVAPREICADRDARKPNYTDAKRIWRLRRFDHDEASALFPDADPANLNAGWASLDEGSTESNSGNDPLAMYEGNETSSRPPDCVIVECQWWEREPFVRFIDGATGEEQEISEAEFGVLVDRLSSIPPEMLLQMGLGLPQNPVTQYRRVYRRAFIGKVILEMGPTPVEGHFSYKAITGKRDETKGFFYGLVRPMKDPQMWTNKLFSQVMHILNSNAKGGIMAERGAFEDDRQAEDDMASANSIVWTNEGALRNGKIAPKPTTAFPMGQAQMLEFSMGSMPLVTGINLEFLGMRETNQPGVLEYQRRQAGVTILATLFDSLRKYRKDQSRLMLGFIQGYLADGRIVKIVEDDQAQYLPLDRSAALGDYEVIVDDAPSAPNAKEREWSILQGMMPMLQPFLQGDRALLAEVVRTSPLPDRMTAKIIEKLMAPPPPPPPEAEMMRRLDMAATVAKVDRDAAYAEKQRADAIQTQAETWTDNWAAMSSGLVDMDLPNAPVPSGPISGMTDMPMGSLTPPTPFGRPPQQMPQGAPMPPPGMGMPQMPGMAPMPAFGGGMPQGVPLP